MLKLSIFSGLLNCIPKQHDQFLNELERVVAQITHIDCLNYNKFNLIKYLIDYKKILLKQ